MDEQDIPADPHSKMKHRVVEDQRDDLGRRKWRLEHYQDDQVEKPLTALQKLRGDIRNQSYLVPREKLAISSKQTKQQALKKANKDGGFYCGVCRQLYKCDTAYLTHLNSSSHNRKLGMSQKVQGVTLESVRDKLQSKMSMIVGLKGGINQQPTMVQRLMKAEILKDKNKAKVEQKQQRVFPENPANKPQQQESEPQADQQPNQQPNHQPEHQSQEQPKEQPEDQSQESVKQQPVNQPEEPAPDQTLLLMQAMGLPTSFKGKRR